MDEVAWTYYRLALKHAFIDRNGMEFQRFFEQVMRMAHGPRFRCVKPGGPQGDLKCDGYLEDGRMLFAVYAPERMESAKTIQKIDEDRSGGIEAWAGLVDTWVFVHNQIRGLPAEVERHIQRIRSGAGHPTTQVWGYDEIQAVLRKLSEEQLSELFGPAPSVKGAERPTMQDIATVIEHISLHDAAAEGAVGPVPPGKVQANGLSDDACQMLRVGMRKAELVRRYLSMQTGDPRLGDRVAKWMGLAYEEERTRYDTADQTLFALYRLLEPPAPTGAQASACWAVLAHFFETCDIFETPAGGDGGAPPDQTP